ncbi:MAG: hypothetical protein ACREDO_11555 [Methyloceanibacter sp.]
MDTAIGLGVLVLALLLLWTGRRRLEFTSFVATLLSIAELVGFLVSAVALGWVGVAILVVVNALAVLVWSVVLAAKKQAILTAASVQGSAVSVNDAEEIWRGMGRQKSFSTLPPLGRAELIRALSVQAREPEEIKAMSAPIAQLSVIFGCDPQWLAPRFDQLLRLYGKHAHQATEVADTLMRATQLAATSFEEMVEAMRIAAAGEDPGNEAANADSDSGDAGFFENLRANAEMLIHQDGKQGVRLNGGPMDGWLVKPGAPSLAPDWYRTWPPTMAKHHRPGHYELADSGPDLAASGDW